ncbi:hypothetical protein [uncultured Halomonas sp.]|uniref:hypothetical protein n=1 Tax=uncultured Halomonas sp. TaxID=173971 RepID=UPI00262966CB|nr:hypothetical protein [uncultured Halomonas sp.]
MNQLEKTGLITIAVGALAFLIGIFTPDLIISGRTWPLEQLAFLFLGGVLSIIGLGVYVFGLSKKQESS